VAFSLLDHGSMQQWEGRMQVPALAMVWPIDTVVPVLALRRGRNRRRKTIVRVCSISS